MIRVLFSFFILWFSMSPVWALTIHEVRVGQHDGKSRLVLELSDAQDYRAFVLGNPNRLVIDLPSFSWNVKNIKTKVGSGIREIRHGNLSDGVSRIVLDMDRQVLVDKAFMLQGPHRLVIDYKTASTALFEAQRKTIFGALDPDKQPETVAFGVPQPTQKPFAQPKRESTRYKPLIVIDPGHGGVDPGAVGANGAHEKHVVLALSKELKNQLLATGRYRVKLTREKDNFIRLHKRVQFARQYEADLFVSIHADSVDKSHVQGASIYTLSEKASDKQSAKLAARENQADLIAGIDLSVEDDEVAGILVDLAMRDTMNQSRFFANKVAGAFKTDGVKTLKTPNRSAGFAVLKAPDIPSVLVEAGFMSNRAEANRLNTSVYRKKVSRSLVKGIDLYFEQVRKNERI